MTDKHKLRLQNKIGRGAFGDVFKGTLDGETVAVKTIRGSNDGRAEEMFLREARILEACAHRHIIGFKKLCKLNADKQRAHGKWALVLEYAKAGTLFNKISAQMVSSGGKVYSDVQALTWALQVASALEHLHLRNPAIVHRDVKLSNVMLACCAGGALEAKLSDFGLHVVADSSKDRRIRMSAALARSMPQQERQQLLVKQLQVTKQQQDATTHSEFLGDSAWQQRQHDGAKQKLHHSAPVGVAGSFGSRPSASQADQMYSEIHDSGGSMSFVGLSERTAADTNSCIRPGSSCLNDAAADASARGAAAVDDQQQEGDAGPGRSRHPPVARRRSFRRASHHPAGDLGVPRVGAPLAPLQPTAAASQSGSEWQAAASSSGLSSARGGSFLAGAASVGAEQNLACSSSVMDMYNDDADSIAATDATWESQTNSCCSSTDGDYESIASELETVFDMTGVTGSCLYMAPEVFLGEPYNEKADVFSFGVVLYELAARCLVMFTELPTSTTDPEVAAVYARKVAGGYRPSRPKKFDDRVWELITACWQQEPIHRPHMSEVVDVLTKLVEVEKSARGGGRASVGRRPSGLLTAPSSISLPATVPEINSADHTELAPTVLAAMPGNKCRTASGSSSDATPCVSVAAGPSNSQAGVKASQGCACVIC